MTGAQLPAGSRAAGRRRSGSALARLVVCLLALGPLVSSLDAGAGLSSSNAPVIIRTEQNQLFRGLRRLGGQSQDVISFLGECGPLISRPATVGAVWLARPPLRAPIDAPPKDAAH